MKEIFEIKIVKTLNTEEIKYLNDLPERESKNILDEHRENLIEYFLSEGIEYEDIKTLEINFTK